MLRNALLAVCLSVTPTVWAATSLEGSCLEKLSWRGDYMVELAPKVTITYRWSGDEKYYFLVEPVAANTICGPKVGHKIVASLQIPDVEGGWYAINFDCSNSKDVKTGDPIVGVFQGNGALPSLAAWRIDVKTRQFQKTDNVLCKSFS